MAQEDFKNIDTRTGFRILDKDRAIIERGKMSSFFGRGQEDIIEFVIFDANDNQLPQGDSGELTRHISINVQNINEYFLSKDNGKDGGEEYFIDVEKLLREAGYEQGLFKVQFQLLNNRIGRHNTEKMYIHEIAPSRTEVRLVPVTNPDGTVDEDLFNRYNSFVQGKTFRDDIIYLVEEFLSQFNVQDIVTRFLNKFGADYRNLILQEFNVDSFDGLIKRIVDQVKEAIRYYVEGKYFDPSDKINYGRPRPNTDDVVLDVGDILKRILELSCNITNKELPIRNAQDETYVKRVLDESIDVKELIETIKGDSTYEGGNPTTTPTEETQDSPTGGGTDSPTGGGVPHDTLDNPGPTEEEEEVPSSSYLRISPTQVGNGSSIGGTFNVSVDTSHSGQIRVEYNDGYGWITANRQRFGPGTTPITFTYNPEYIMEDFVDDSYGEDGDKIYDGNLSPGLPINNTGNITPSGGGGGGGQRMEDGLEEFRNPYDFEQLN